MKRQSQQTKWQRCAAVTMKNREGLFDGSSGPQMHEIFLVFFVSQYLVSELNTAPKSTSLMHS